MTNAKAIEILREKINEEFSTDTAEAFCMAISALEKQVGKKPFWNGAFYECSNCNTSFGDNDERPMYCDICGQRIDWSDEHETD